MAMTSVSYADGRQLDPGQFYFEFLKSVPLLCTYNDPRFLGGLESSDLAKHPFKNASFEASRISQLPL